ncbi:MarR family winged helix-turn-helix transcriptional regulator [Proteocatella sphenisci]|uniref:MarR family winged helix-turn-helix transcriptional regulator n=1 Tax=Proteocatella sphenisci TaxID=181070 RepID=UPI00049040EE|nr:MarR family transcriptional regulator [Proteocatella sphenisci]
MKYEKLKLENQLCFPLYALSREVIKLYKPFLDKYDMTYTQYVTMLVMWEYEEIFFKELGLKLHLDSGTLTPVVKKLESMNLLTKKRDESDDRQVKVTLTQKGKDIKEDMVEIPQKMAEKFKGNEILIMELKKNLDSVLNIMFE